MRCPYCQHLQTRVLETRTHPSGEIRRRRECLKCKSRLTTTEVVLIQLPHVVKKDGSREPFNKDKLRKGLQLACLKRPVNLASIEEIVARIAKQVSGDEHDIDARQLGEMVMRELKAVDSVAYVRFASVYRTFHDVHEFVEYLDSHGHPMPLTMPIRSDL